MNKLYKMFNKKLNSQDNDLNFYELMFGYSCNNDCIHCFQGGKKEQEDLTTFEVKRIIDTIDSNRGIIFTGGEPTVRSDLFEILEYAKNENRQLAIYTNGQRFEDEEFLNNILSYVDLIFLAFHSVNLEMHDYITRTPNSGEKTFQGLRNLKDSKALIITNTVINRINYKYLVDILDHIHSVLPEAGLSLTFTDPKGYAYSTKITPRYSEVKPHLLEALAKYSNLLRTHYIPRCHLYPYQDKVLNWDRSHGHVYRPGIDYINSWEEIDYGKVEKNSKIKSIFCKECIFDDICEGVWREYGELYKDFHTDLRPIKKDV